MVQTTAYPVQAPPSPQTTTHPLAHATRKAKACSRCTAQTRRTSEERPQPEPIDPHDRAASADQSDRRAPTRHARASARVQTPTSATPHAPSLATQRTHRRRGRERRGPFRGRLRRLRRRHVRRSLTRQPRRRDGRHCGRRLSRRRCGLGRRRCRWHSRRLLGRCSGWRKRPRILYKRHPVHRQPPTHSLYDSQSKCMLAVHSPDTAHE